MEMEDDHNPSHHHHHHNQYGNMADLRQLINGGASLFAPSAAASGHQFDMMTMVGTEIIPPRRPQDFGADNAGAGECDLGGGVGGGDGGSGRGPRQETLTLLEIRSRLDPKFKEANHKGPLWDEVSRIMCEEHGYQRSGKKCREKFENLYKYYKKTKEGKAGRQDGKNYRFFRQLEALYGETNYNLPQTHLVPSHQDHKMCDSLSLSNSSDFEAYNSSEDNDSSEKRSRKRRSGGRRWKVKIKDFIDSQMRKLMEKQEAWLEKMMTSLEQKEQERMAREEQWREQEVERMDRERKFWAKERAWIETRDAALMEILGKIRGRDRDRDRDRDDDEDDNDQDLMKVVTTTTTSSSPEERMRAEFRNQDENEILNSDATIKSCSTNQNNWEEPEMTRLIQLRSGLESRMQQIGHNPNGEEVLWGEISAKMCCYGYERSATMCKEKWEAINYYLINKANVKEECNKKLREDNSSSRASSYFHNNDSSLYNKYDGSSPSSSNAGNAVQDSSFHFLMMGDGDHHNLWENYGLKLNKGQNH